MAGRIFVTGGSGFVGSAVVEELVTRGFGVNMLARRGDRTGEGDVRMIRGDLFDGRALAEGMAGCEAAIHLVGIIMEKRGKGVTFERIHFDGTRSVVTAAVKAGIRRYVHMSALGARPGAVSEYHRTKWAAEEYVRGSALDWTIIRPSLIHGPKGEFMRMEAMWARRRAPAPVFVMPVMPYFGAGILGTGGAGKLQPVYVKDVARAFVDCLTNNKTSRETYPLGGTEQLTWPQLHHTVSEKVVGKRRFATPIPVWAAKLYAAVGVAKLLGFNRDQVIMSQEDNTCDLGKFEHDFGWTPVAFTESLTGYADQL